MEPSHFMRAMGIPYTAGTTPRGFRCRRYNTESESDCVIVATSPIIAQLRKISPYWGEKVSEVIRM